MYEHYSRILTERGTLLSLFQPRFHSPNCPAVAAAFQRFLETGVVARAIDVPPGFGCQDSGSPFVRIGLSGLLSMALTRGHGFQVVVGATAPGREHYANVVNINGSAYYVDAFTRPGGVSRANDLASWLSWAISVEYSTRYTCRLVPI